MSTLIIDTATITNQEEITDKLYEFISRPELYARGKEFACYINALHSSSSSLNFEAMDLLNRLTGFQGELYGSAVFVFENEKL